MKPIHYLYLFVLFILSSCNQTNTNTDVQPKDSIILAYEIIPPKRDSANKKPIAVYSESIKGYDIKHGFYVEVYETEETFHYKIKMCYKNIDGIDTLKIPNFGIWPKPEIMKGDKRPSCVVGFEDKEGKFKESKLIADDGDGNLRVQVLKHYAVYTFRDSVKNKK